MQPGHRDFDVLVYSHLILPPPGKRHFLIVIDFVETGRWSFYFYVCFGLGYVFVLLYFIWQREVHEMELLFFLTVCPLFLDSASLTSWYFIFPKILAPSNSVSRPTPNYQLAILSLYMDQGEKWGYGRRECLMLVNIRAAWVSPAKPWAVGI